MKDLELKFKVSSMDAEVQTIEVVPKLIGNLTKDRAINVLKYCIDRLMEDDTYTTHNQ